MQPICPIDKAVMVQGEDGVYRCRRQHRHEFRVIGRRHGAPGPTHNHCNANMACPACGAEMTPGEHGVWICTADKGHRMMIVPEPFREPEAKADLIRESPLIDRARGAYTPTHWLAHIGITTPLLPPTQGNTGDGSICQALGDIKPGGGSKSGRRRKKPPKKKAGPLEAWGA